MTDKPTTEEIAKQVEDRAKAEAEGMDNKTETVAELIDDKLIGDCRRSNERGDGIMYATINKDKFLYNKTSGSWLRWNGQHWEYDIMDTAHEAVEEVALKYLEGADKLEGPLKEARADNKDDKNKSLISILENQQKALTERARQLRGLKRSNACLTYSHRILDGLGIKGHEFDRNPLLLACENGVIELDSGIFRKGRPDDYLLKSAPHEFKDISDTDCPKWEKFLSEVFGNDKDLIDYVQRLCGYSISGLTHEHVVAVLYGEGRNGKGTFVETLRHVLGDQAQPIQSEMLLDQRGAQSSAGASPHIMSLKGLRIGFASETDEGRKFSPAKVKLLSGGDTLVGRNPYDKHETSFTPTHTLCLLTNHLPHAPGDDYGFWQRLQVILFEMKFVDNPEPNTNERQKDKTLLDSLKKEAPAILAWLCRGFLDWQKQGFNPPEKVKNATLEYQLDEDVISRFIEDKCYELKETDSEFRTPYADLCSSFEVWYEETISKNVPKRGWIAKSFMKKGIRKERPGGDVVFFGIQLKPSDD